MVLFIFVISLSFAFRDCKWMRRDRQELAAGTDATGGPAA